MNFLLPLLGRLHPLLVHLPIGILFLSVLLTFISKGPQKDYIPAIRTSLLAGMLFAFASSISGFLQYQNEGFSWESVQFHLIFGWLTVAASLLLFLYFKKIEEIQPKTKWLMALLFLLLTITGHLGGNITHGDDYFLEVLPPNIQALAGYSSPNEKGLELPEIGWEEIEYFEGVIQPILNHNCESCHNPRNLKGELDLSSYQSLLQGGEDGLVLIHGNHNASELFSRMNLPKEDENHMPPKEKRQPKVEEIELIRIWIESGAEKDVLLGEVSFDDSVLEPFFVRDEKPFYPQISLEKLSEEVLDNLRGNQLYAEPIASNSNWIEISAINKPDFSTTDFGLLETAKNHVVSLDLSQTQITDAALDSIASFPNLTILKLNETNLSGTRLEALNSCQNLKLLYINGIAISPKNLVVLNDHPKLEKVYLFNSSGESTPLNLSFKIEKGSFSLPLIPSDTVDYLKD